MKISQIYEILDEIAPFCDQENWDNSGLLIGDFNNEINLVYASLDVDSELVAELAENSLLLTHHPLIFNGIKRFDFSLYPSNIIRQMISKNINLISMHTNFDKHLLNSYFVNEILGLKISKKDEFLIYADVDLSFAELANLIKTKMELKTLRATFAKEHINRIAICTGSGGDLISKVRADAFITGDLKYHQALQAKENGLNLFDIGHFESERYFGDCVAKALQKKQIEVIIKNSINPFIYI